MNPIYAPRPWVIKVKFPLIERISPLPRQVPNYRSRSTKKQKNASSTAACANSAMYI